MCTTAFIATLLTLAKVLETYLSERTGYMNHVHGYYIMQPFKNEAVLYTLSRIISKIHSKVGKRCKTTQNSNSLGKIDIFLCAYKLIYYVYKKLKIIGCL